MGDGGYPFITEFNTLTELIPPPTLFSKLQNKVIGPGQSTQTVLPENVLSSVYWRRTNARYTKNEVYFDIIEKIQCVIERGGAIANAEIVGEVLCKSQLSGMPDLSLKLTNPLLFDDVSFHQCIRYAKWESEKILSFVPPDGDFKLMDFRVVGSITLPFYIFPQIQYTETGAKVLIKIGQKPNISPKPMEKIIITIPFSKQTTTSTLSANSGTVNFDDTAKVCTWKLDSFSNGEIPTLEGTVSQPPGSYKPDVNPTILIDFTLVGWSVSGIKIDNMNLYGEKYNPYKAVRNITRGGSIQVRT